MTCLAFEVQWVMGLLFWVLLLLCWEASCDGSGLSVRLTEFPNAVSRRNTTAFSFEPLVNGNVEACSDCKFCCKLDSGAFSDCRGRKVSYGGLLDGNHSFEVCANGSQGIGCASYNWTIDTIPPTAYITSPASLTSAVNVSVTILFSEPCVGGGGFGCSSVDSCNLLVYGAGQVIPSTLNILQPNLEYTLLVSLNSTIQYGRVILVMDKNFCTDNAGNPFTRTANSSFYVHFDRRNVLVDLRTRIPEKMLQVNNQIRTVQATNNQNNLRVYLYFSEPVMNSSAEILESLNTSQGTLLPTNGKTLGNRKFGFTVANTSGIAIITISLKSESIISRQATAVSPIAPVTFLYDSQRPTVRLSTTSTSRTREHNIPISIKFAKPVFGFNSSNIAISGGHLQSFYEMSRSKYSIEIKAEDDIVSVSIPENATGDVAGNKNLPSNILQVRHYSMPVVSSVASVTATAAFCITSLAAGLLSVSTASLLAIGAFPQTYATLISSPSRNLFRIVCHIQVFALSRWLAVILPVEYYELARDLQWSIPYFSLPWEVGHIQPVMVGSSPPANSTSYFSEVLDLETIGTPKEENLKRAATVYGLPLSPMEYKSFFEMENSKPEVEYILDPQHMSGWRDFSRNMFWLAIIGGSLILLHALLLLILKFKKKTTEKQDSYGALTFPRLEMFLLVLALPSICQASSALIQGVTPSGVVVGILLLGFVSFELLSLFLFLSVGITFGKLLQYKEVHQVGRRFHWYQELIRVTLGPGKRGQWTWKKQPNSAYLIKYGPLFEDLRGPPKYMLSQISGGQPRKGDRIIASEDETEDAEAPFIQKIFGILRIFYTLLECIKRVALGILAGTYMNDWSSRTPTSTLLCVTSFQLFFLVLKKPFIKKKVQLVEIISVSTEVGIFASCAVLLRKEFSEQDETCMGIFMVALFLIGFVAQMVNEWYALYKQTKRLDPDDKSFLLGLKVALLGVLIIFVPRKLSQGLESNFPKTRPSGGENGDTGSSAGRNRSSGSRSSGSTDKPWLRQLRELAKASFSREGSSAVPNDPSSSRPKWSDFWGTKKSGGTSASSSSDFNSKPTGLYKELEAIFASK
ncbi:hypothetical protein NL676_003278 [Syzygium grande]|nr:hypothetical protein NL676_003278 [Syzygium grande]